MSPDHNTTTHKLNLCGQPTKSETHRLFGSVSVALLIILYVSWLVGICNHDSCVYLAPIRPINQYLFEVDTCSSLVSLATLSTSEGSGQQDYGRSESHTEV